MERQLMRGTFSWVFLVVGASLLALSIPAGYLNRTVLDAPTFARNVDELRRRDDVSQAIGRDVARQIIDRNPNLVALAPLITQISTAVVSSDALSGPVRLAAAQFNRALTEGNSTQLVLRVADVGAVVAGVVGVVAPDRAASAGDVSVTLVNVGSQSFAAKFIRYADIIDTLAWLLPLLATVLLIAAVLLDVDRWRALRRIGWAFVLAIVLFGVVVAIGGAILRGIADGPQTAAVLDGVWDIFIRPIWWSLGIVAGLGALMIVTGSGRAADWEVGRLIARVSTPPSTTRGVVVGACVSIMVGIVAIIEPLGLLTLLAFVAGVILVVSGVAMLSRLARPQQGVVVASGERRTPLMVIGGLGVIALVVMAVWAGRSPDTAIAGVVGDAVVGDGEVCNGHAELCAKRFDEVSFAATHNSMSVAGKPGWFIGEQGLDIIPSLDSGVRALLVDVWYGRAAGGSNVRTAARSYQEALAVANEDLGPGVVESALRVFDAVAGPVEGPEKLYMCHGLCETGSTSFDDTLGDIRTWLATNPDEVMTIFVEDHADADDIGRSVLAAGLGDYLFTPEQGEPFPTLHDMIRSGTRLVVMLEAGDGRPEYPWLVNGFDFVQDTPYTFPTVESFSCAPNRGGPDAPLLLINHWLSGFTNLVSDARLVNAADVLRPRVEHCREVRGMQPTYVAVNYADIGDLMAVIDRLNGVD